MKTFLATTMLFAAMWAAQAQTAADSAVYRNFLDMAHEHRMFVDLSSGERTARIASFFLGTPYVGGTLEAPGPERLQVNLREMDCTTLVENVLALSRMLQDGAWSMDHFKTELSRLRYRDGRPDGYASRLHYTSDWLFSNVAGHGLQWVDLGKDALPFHPRVGFMSTHPQAYPALRADSTLIPVVAGQERRIDSLVFSCLPKEKLTDRASFIHDGDIVAITTNLPGLDFSHLGIAVRKKGKLHLLHASSTAGKVVISTMSLSDYLAGIRKHTGIVVVRPL